MAITHLACTFKRTGENTMMIGGGIKITYYDGEPLDRDLFMAPEGEYDEFEDFEDYGNAALLATRTSFGSIHRPVQRRRSRGQGVFEQK